MSRRPLVVGNWKMNTSRQEAVALARAVAGVPIAGVDVVVCPPFPWLSPVRDAIAGSAVVLGAQDCWTESSGAFTGAVSPAMIGELCRYVIVGHSERRRIFGETDQLVARKLTAAITAGLLPILCVGEALEARRAGNAGRFVRSQIEIALRGQSQETVERCIIAYEPVWAIGTGVAAEPSDAEEMAREIRSCLAFAGEETGDRVRILYGGSVTPANAGAILGGANVDGALVGGASLQAGSFLGIAAAAGH